MKTMNDLKADQQEIERLKAGRAEVPHPQLKELCEEAAQKWFAETEQVLEINQERTGDGFADAGRASLGLAVQKLSGIISEVFAPYFPQASQVLDEAIKAIESRRAQIVDKDYQAITTCGLNEAVEALEAAKETLYFNVINR